MFEVPIVPDASAPP